MIIRNEVLKTLKASPLNSRSVRRTCGQMATVESTLKGCPNSAVGRPIQGRCGALVISGGAAHHPAIERRRFQRHYHVFADNHLADYFVLCGCMPVAGVCDECLM